MAREIASAGQNSQAVKMLKKNKKRINSFKVGDLVLVATESVDRGAADARNLLCYIMSKKTDAFVLGCKAGRLDCVFQWNQLTKCDLATTWSIEDVPDKEISIRSAIIAVSISHGQGVIRCGCKKACTGKCRCLANNQK